MSWSTTSAPLLPTTCATAYQDTMAVQSSPLPDEFLKKLHLFDLIFPKSSPAGRCCARANDLIYQILLAAYMQGLSPQIAKHFTLRNVGLGKQDRPLTGNIRRKSFRRAWHKLPARARPMLPTLLEGLSSFTNGIIRSRISDSLTCNSEQRPFFLSPPS